MDSLGMLDPGYVVVVGEEGVVGVVAAMPDSEGNWRTGRLST